jgi:NAD(P)-dependent dehydrogenase (short-subunit alcohol dehydrogenase family)
MGYMYALISKVVLVTGASSGIGLALARLALEQGAFVAACARNLQKLTDAFPAADPEYFLAIQADVRHEADCERFVAAAAAKWGRVDVLINNAGISMRALFEEASLDVMRELMDINFWGAVYCTHFALPHILKTQGVIVGVSSIAGYRGLPGRTGYSASKFAMQGFLEALRTEMLRTGVHVMWVCPGFTASNIRNVALGAEGRPQGETPLEESRLMSADQCASIILDGIARKRRTLVMTGQGKLTVLLNKLFPGFVDGQVYKVFLKEPGSPLLKYESPT